MMHRLLSRIWVQTWLSGGPSINASGHSFLGWCLAIHGSALLAHDKISHRQASEFLKSRTPRPSRLRVTKGLNWVSLAAMAAKSGSSRAYRFLGWMPGFLLDRLERAGSCASGYWQSDWEKPGGSCQIFCCLSWTFWVGGLEVELAKLLSNILLSGNRGPIIGSASLNGEVGVCVKSPGFG